MVRAGRKISWAFAVAILVCALTRIFAQDSVSPLVTSGQRLVGGHSVPYLIRHLPVSSFPQLPTMIEQQLNQRGCLIPQTFEAHGPENVVHASLDHAGSSDWAVLCSVNGTVSLLVFFGNSDSSPVILATASEISRLQPAPGANILGFNWGIDPASPEAVHEAQLGMRHPPPRLDHDSLADSVVDQKTVYRFYAHGRWTTVDTQD